ncbi:hypothetical protein [Bacillus coahuilensis]|uniref:hypothetical protein n=1 Tax=Bacillus coahuilensis TaxID=408580 RepID=UPI000AC857D3|nr:hypothetical protein [Bacillus coahuilensis]
MTNQKGTTLQVDFYERLEQLRLKTRELKEECRKTLLEHQEAMKCLKSSKM